MTAVKWLQEALSIHLTFEQQMQFEGLFQQAKEMEKQQIIDAFNEGYFDEKSSDQYYNEKFNLSQQDKP
jgi:hypothetical protein